jgi:hypothetical protein
MAARFSVMAPQLQVCYFRVSSRAALIRLVPERK